MAESIDPTSVLGGSEAVFDFYCELCNEDGLHIEADGYCTECGEYLCGQCVIYHQKTRLTRSHKVLDKENMPTDTPPTSDRVRKDISSVCQLHKGKPVEFYCKSHDILGCSSCFLSDHRSCPNIDNITVVSMAIFDSKQYKEFLQNLQSLGQQVRDIITESRDNLAKSDHCFSAAIDSIRRFREEIDSLLDELENRLLAEIESYRTNDISNGEFVSSSCATLQESIDKLTSEFESLESANRVCQTYIRIKEATADVKDIERQLKQVRENCTEKLFTFVPNEDLRKLLTGPDALGLLSMVSKREQDTASTSTSVSSVPLVQGTVSTSTFVRSPLVQDTASTSTSVRSPLVQDTVSTFTSVRSVTFIQDIDVKSTSGMDSCIITGSAVLSDSKLVIVDYINCKVKLVDTHSMRIISEIQVPQYPWDVTVIKKDQMAVTVPDKKTILVLRVTGSITKVREITVNGQCWGISYSKNQLIVTYSKPAKLEIMDLQGNVNSKIESDKDGHQLFKLPRYVCVSSDGDTLYVSDFSANKVVSLSRSGVVKAIYTDNNLRSPEKVCLDHRGNVFVCGCDSYNIHMFTPECSKIKEILTKTDGLTNNVYSVTHCRQTDRLYVGLMHYDKVKVFQLS